MSLKVINFKHAILKNVKFFDKDSYQRETFIYIRLFLTAVEILPFNRTYEPNPKSNSYKTIKLK